MIGQLKTGSSESATDVPIDLSFQMKAQLCFSISSYLASNALLFSIFFTVSGLWWRCHLDLHDILQMFNRYMRSSLVEYNATCSLILIEKECVTDNGCFATSQPKQLVNGMLISSLISNSLTCSSYLDVFGCLVSIWKVLAEV